MKGSSSPGKSFPPRASSAPSSEFRGTWCDRRSTTSSTKGSSKASRASGPSAGRGLPNLQFSTNIGLVEFFISSYIYPQVIRGCYNTLSRKGFALLLNQSEYNLERETSDSPGSAQEEGRGHHHRPDLRCRGPIQRPPPGGDPERGHRRGPLRRLLPRTGFQQRHPRLSQLRGGGRRSPLDKGASEDRHFLPEGLPREGQPDEGSAGFPREPRRRRCRDAWIVGFNGQGPASGAADAAERFSEGNQGASQRLRLR